MEETQQSQQAVAAVAGPAEQTPGTELAGAQVEKPSPPAQSKPAPRFKAPRKKRKWVKRLITVVVLVVIVALLLSRCMAGGQGTATAAYIPIQAAYQDLTVAVSGTGTIQPIDSYRATALVKGEVLEAPFDVGDTVQKDDVLFRVDAKDVEASIQQQEIALEQARVNYNQLLSSQSDAQKNQQVKANANGVVTKVYVDPGDNVTAGAPIADILDRDHMKLEVPFHAADMAGIAVGQGATVTVDGTGESIPGTVDSIAATDSVGAGGTLVRKVTILVNNPGALTDTSTGTAAIGSVTCAAGGSFAYGQSKQVVAKTTGELQSLTVREGDRVSDGQLIGSFDDTDMDSQIENARLSIESAELSLQNARESLDDYVITSPISGTVIEMNYGVGDNIDPTATAASGYLAVIYDMSALEFEMQIDELDISKIQVGQMVSITADALDGQTFTGRVDKVNINGVTANGATTYPVTVLVDDPQNLLPGMNVSARIIVEELPHVLCVPVEAVSRDNTVLVTDASALSEDGLTVADPTKIRTVEVTLGRNSEEYIEITGGLSEGEIVLIESQGSSFMDMMTSTSEETGED